MLRKLKSAVNINYFKRLYCEATCYPAGPCDPGVQVSILPNGIRVATECKETALVCINMYVEEGSRFETKHNNGMTHFIEHMAYKGFNTMAQFQLEQTLQQLGIRMSAETTREFQVFSAKCLPECVPCAVDILSKIVTDLSLCQAAIDQEKYNICLEMVDADDDPRQVTFDYLHQTAFQGTPLAQRVIGSTYNVQNFDQCFAVNFQKDHYQPYKICFASSGCVDHCTMLLSVDTCLGRVVSDPGCPAPSSTSRFTGSQIMYRDDSMEFAHVAVALEAPGYGSEDYWMLFVASCLLGEWDKTQGGGLCNSSPLAIAASCADLCQSFESFYITYRDVGLWGIYFVAERMKLEDMLANVQDQWMKLCIMMSESELKRAVALAKMKLLRRREGAVKSSQDVGFQMLYSCTRQPLEEMFELLDGFKVGKVRALCEHVLFDRCPAVAAVGPVENLPEYNRIRAGQYWLRV